MRKLYLGIGIGMGLVFLLSGCAPTYSITPVYDKEKSIVAIDDYNVNEITHELKKVKNGKRTSSEYIRFKSNSADCKKFAYRLYTVGHNIHYLASAREDILEKYENDCKIEQVGNLNFFKCVDKKQVEENSDSYLEVKMHYGITSSVTNEYGYTEKLKVYLGSTNKCFDSIKNHFVVKTEPQYVNITHNFKKKD